MAYREGEPCTLCAIIYEADFLGFSYECRPDRSPHEALAVMHAAFMTVRELGARSGTSTLLRLG